MGEDLEARFELAAGWTHKRALDEDFISMMIMKCQVGEH